MNGADIVADAELVLKFKGGEKLAFETLVRRHMKDAYAFCMRLTHNAWEAEELSQRGFVSAYRALHGFRGDSSFRSWLYRIFINLHRDRLRRDRRETARREAAREAAIRLPVEGSEARAEELEGVVKERIARLPERQREVLLLHLYQGMSYAEIGAALECSYDDVKTNLSLARKRLKQELRNYL